MNQGPYEIPDSDRSAKGSPAQDLTRKIMDLG
jgi:hypothetical protein